MGIASESESQEDSVESGMRTAAAQKTSPKPGASLWKYFELKGIGRP